MMTANAPTAAPGTSVFQNIEKRLFRTVPPEKVQRWFMEANVFVPSEEIAATLALKVTLLNIGWSLGSYKKAKEAQRFEESAKRIGVAISTLRKELPGLLEEYNSPSRQPLYGFVEKPKTPPYRKKLKLMSRLHEVIDLIVREEVFQDHLPVMGRPRAAWHGLARELGEEIVAALKASGVKRAGFGKGTSPALQVLKSALGWLGVHEKDDALIMAMRRNRERGKKVT